MGKSNSMVHDGVLQLYAGRNAYQLSLGNLPTLVQPAIRPYKSTGAIIRALTQ